MKSWSFAASDHRLRSPHSDLTDISSQSPVRRSRASKPKVKSGCLTCKSRRVKCDESKPQCRRCINAGRQCGGYAHSKEHKSLDTYAGTHLLLRRCPEVCVGDEAEVSALEFFYRQTAPQLASYFDADFWMRLILQVSHAEGAVRHAIIALGSLARQQGEQAQQVSSVCALAVQDASHAPDPSRMVVPLVQAQEDIEEKFALVHYGKAVTDLSSRMCDPDVPVETVLLACILFVCVEFLRGNLPSALKHFRGGMNVTLASLSHKYAIDSMAESRIRQNVLPFFNRLELLACLVEQDPGPEYNVMLEDCVPKAFANMRQARNTLVDLMNHGVRFIRANKVKRYMDLVSQEDLAKQKLLYQQLDKWRYEFGSLLLSESITALELDGARLLELHFIITNIWISVAVTPDECKNDEWNEYFDRAVSLAESLQHSSSRCRCSSPSFLFDMEVVSPLHFVVTKCRHPVIRRRANAILKNTSKREGLWDAQLDSVLAERLMAFEEKGLAILDGTELPLERNRIHATQIQANSTVQSYTLTHFYRPEGLYGPWKALKEEIRVVRGH